LLEFFKNLFFRKKDDEDKLPFEINDDERIVRSLFSPINFNKSGELKSNAFRTPPEKDEVSVNRLDYTTATFCKKLSKKIENPSYDRSYFGLALLTAKEIRNSNSDVIYTPILNEKDLSNSFHSDIKIGYIPKRGEPLPAEFQLKVIKLTEKARLFLDPNPNSLNWEGEDLKY
tara:strand:- start:3118 stop:3636 length:519 start_codon:yes stop_codon:yes gene_type:complete